MAGRVVSGGLAIDRDIIREGDTCAGTALAGRGCFILDTADYYRAVREAVLAAERRVCIIGWDFHSRMRMLRDGDDGYPAELGAFLNAALERNTELEIYVLIWDYSMIYAAEREWDTFLGRSGMRHERLHYRKDDKVPMGASHHQKMVVADDRIAFAGGMDLAAWRWDEKAHEPEDPRREDPDGKPYQPYQDIQMAVTGDAAGWLGREFRDRWERATGEELQEPEAVGDVPWPESLGTDFEEVELGFARTYAEYEQYPEVHEIEELHLSIIGKAERYLYIENQYLSSQRIGEALCAKLREADGPEVVMVLTKDEGSWMERNTMGVVRDRLLGLMREADEYGRLRVFYPKVPGENGEDAQVYVHTKLIIADGRVVKIGSPNLTNRSMRVDSELDVVMAERGEVPYVATLLHRMLGVSHRMEPGAVAEVAEKENGLLALVDALRKDEGHSLAPFPVNSLSDFQKQLADGKLLDPEEPMDPGRWIRSETPEGERISVTKRVLVICAVILGLAGLTLLYGKGMGKLVDREGAMAFFETIRDSPWMPLILTGVFILASIVGFSLNVLLVGAALVLNPWVAFASGLAGAQIGANLGFLLGRLWGTKLMQRFAPERLQGLSRKLGERSVFSVAILRLLPIAPFPLVNIAAGSSHLGAKVFNLGSLLGMAPGMLGVVLLADVTKTAMRQPDPWNVALVVVVAAVFVVAVWFVRRSLRSSSMGRKES